MEKCILQSAETFKEHRFRFFDILQFLELHFQNIQIPGPRKSGEITLNGAAAHKVSIGDVLILITYAFMELQEAKEFKPSLVFPNEANNLLN